MSVLKDLLIAQVKDMSTEWLKRRLEDKDRTMLRIQIDNHLCQEEASFLIEEIQKEYDERIKRERA